MSRFLLMPSSEKLNLFLMELLMFKSHFLLESGRCKYWISQIFYFPTFSSLTWKKRNPKIYWSDDIWILSYDYLNFSPWPKENWKNKPATLNVIHLLYGALSINSRCYCDSLGWYLSENTNFRIFCFPD